MKQTNYLVIAFACLLLLACVRVETQSWILPSQKTSKQNRCYKESG